VSNEKYSLGENIATNDVQKGAQNEQEQKGVNLHSKGAQVGWTGTWVYLKAAVGRGFVLDSGYHDMLICSWRDLINR
jgi:hypothetical protein